MNRDSFSGTASATDAETFFSSINAPVDLFRIVPGIPFQCALEQVTLLLGYIHHLIFEEAMEPNGRMLWAAYYLSGFAKAILNEVEVGASSKSLDG